MSAKYEISIELDSPMNFFIFPNYIYDRLVVRDERMARIIDLKEETLIIDATSSKMDIVRKY